eukprot:symbB.v1.2.023921.t1/scaffold2226.1/size85309/5
MFSASSSWPSRWPLLPWPRASRGRGRRHHGLRRGQEWWSCWLTFEMPGNKKHGPRIMGRFLRLGHHLPAWFAYQTQRPVVTSPSRKETTIGNLVSTAGICACLSALKMPWVLVAVFQHSRPGDGGNNHCKVN